jgi:peptidoglycan/LPS O-acetylase OafA/YrhL
MLFASGGLGSRWKRGRPVSNLSTSDRTGGVRILSLDAWRGLAALMVVGMHAAAPGSLIQDGGATPSLVDRLIVFGNYGVQIFFVISGLCVAQAALRAFDKSSPIADFALARFRRIYPPYAIVSALAILASLSASLLIAHHALPHSEIGDRRLFARPAGEYVCAALLLQKVCNVEPFLPVFWTLCYEVAFYFIVCASLILARISKRIDVIFLACHALTLFCCSAALVAPGVAAYPLDLWPQFGVGVIVLDVLSYRRASAYVLLVVTLLMQAAYALPHLGGGTALTPSVGVATLTALTFAVALLAISPVDARIARATPVRLLARVGAFSYSLYLSHWLVIGPVGQVMKKFHLGSPSLYWLSALIQIAAAILAARVFFAFAERPFLSHRRLILDRQAISRAAAGAA